MPRYSNVLTVSLPQNMTRAVDALSEQTDQTRSEFIRNVLREYLLDIQEDRERFLKAYKQTRKEKTITMSALKKKYDLV
jgi:metal-responsive CopG/Arc/MetJ family transcriptional regulator